MIEDKLTQDQRIRLEALAQSIAANAMHRPSSEKILSDAKQYAAWVEAGDKDVS
jgi:hypothetical protein